MTVELNDMVFVGTHGHVLALRRTSGRKLWTTSLPNTGFSVVSILVEEDQLTCGSGGYVYALDPYNGEILWSNGLRGMGHGQVYLATLESSTDTRMLTLTEAEAAQRAASSSSSGSAGAH